MTKPAHERFTEKTTQLLMWEAENAGFTPADLAEAVGGSPRTFENYKYVSNHCGVIIYSGDDPPPEEMRYLPLEINEARRARFRQNLYGEI